MHPQCGRFVPEVHPRQPAAVGHGQGGRASAARERRLQGPRCGAHARADLRGDVPGSAAVHRLGLDLAAREVHRWRRSLLPELPHTDVGLEVEKRVAARVDAVHGVGGRHESPRLPGLEDHEVLRPLVHQRCRLARGSELPLRPNLCHNLRHGGERHARTGDVRAECVVVHELRGGAPHPGAHLRGRHYAECQRHLQLRGCAGRDDHAVSHRAGRVLEDASARGQKSLAHDVPAGGAGDQHGSAGGEAAVLAAVHHGHAEVPGLPSHHRHLCGLANLHLDALGVTQRGAASCVLLPENDGVAQLSR
mmetsp:Transcript_4210/g.14258  ORF Transcript_4210/g.14258 Transcript_4210/m.14258 type:complete len:306 (-) Transcript_4210:724-1641(-)